jgi:hypothetical protein
MKQSELVEELNKRLPKDTKASREVYLTDRFAVQEDRERYIRVCGENLSKIQDAMREASGIIRYPLNLLITRIIAEERVGSEKVIIQSGIGHRLSVQDFREFSYGWPDGVMKKILEITDIDVERDEKGIAFWHGYAVQNCKERLELDKFKSYSYEKFVRIGERVQVALTSVTLDSLKAPIKPQNNGNTTLGGEEKEQI